MTNFLDNPSYRHCSISSGVASILHQEGHGVHVHDIRQKLSKFLSKYNKLTLSQLKWLWICGWNRKTCNVETSYFTQLKMWNDNVSMSVRHLDHVLIVYSLMEHVTWKSPGPMCGWVGRILHPDSWTSVSSWSKVLLLPMWSVAVPLCRPLLPCPSRWHGSLARHGLWWLTCELHCSPLPWRLGCVYQLWKSPLLSCAPWSSDRTSCLSLQHKNWSSSCKEHIRSIRSYLHPWPCPSDEPQSSVVFGEDG